MTTEKKKSWSEKAAEKRVQKAKVALVLLTKVERQRLFHELGVCSCVQAGVMSAIGGFLGAGVGSLLDRRNSTPISNDAWNRLLGR